MGTAHKLDSGKWYVCSSTVCRKRNAAARRPLPGFKTPACQARAPPALTRQTQTAHVWTTCPAQDEEDTMAFVIRPFAPSVFESHWTPEVQRMLHRFICPEDDALRRRCYPTWAVDEGARASLLPVCVAGQLSAAWCYAFVMRGEFAIIRQENFCLYSFVGLSPGLARRLDEVTPLIAEALRIGGEFLDGKTGVHDVFSVPRALFVRPAAQPRPMPPPPSRSYPSASASSYSPSDFPPIGRGPHPRHHEHIHSLPPHGNTP